MNKIMSCLFILVIMLSCLINTALAGSNSYSIVVSCTIPAIPGVNVPLVEDKTDLEEQKTQGNQGQIENEQMLSSTQEGPFMITKSIYSR